MEIRKNNGNIIVENITDFDLKHVFECGQCFRFENTGVNEYTGVARDKVITLSHVGNELTLYNIDEEEFTSFWAPYLDLNRDYSHIKNALNVDERMTRAISEGNGIRILGQDLFETIVSFIISQSNNIPRIKKIIEALCTHYGTPIEYRGKTYHSFPSPHIIAEADLTLIKAGFRDKYIKKASAYISKNPDFLTQLKESDTATAKSMLMSLDGIGNKVSDCILLFGLNKTDSFPVDVWMHRIMQQLYFKKECTKDEISKYAAEKFGAYSGYAQQYLFYYALNHKSELKEGL